LCLSGCVPPSVVLEHIMATEEGIQLEFSDDRRPLTAVAAINAALSEIGTGVWPLDLRGAPDDIRQLLTQLTLTDAEVERLRTHFLLPRQRLLEIIAAVGREPNVPGGGALTTSVSNHDYACCRGVVCRGCTVCYQYSVARHCVYYV
jgi:hypothetical protein